MFQEPIMNLLQENIPGLLWSMNNRTASDNVGTVYYEGGSKPDIYEVRMRYPIYMIYIRSSDFVKAANYAQQAYDLLQGYSANELEVPIFDDMDSEKPMKVEYYQVFNTEALSEPLRIGLTEDDIMEYSINVQMTARKLY